jgi:Bacterial Ig-like domain (group 3)
LTVGTHSITATYSGDVTYSPGSSPALVHTITPAATTTMLGSSAGPSVFNQPVTVTATVAPVAPGTGTPTGDVAFFRIRGDLTRQWIGTVTLAGGIATVETSALPVGTGNLSAVYRGSTQLSASSATLSQTVGRSDTTMALATTRASARAGRFIAFDGTVTPTAPGAGVPTGTVAFFRLRAGGGRAWLGNRALRHGTARLRTNSIPLGTHTIVAVYRASPSYGTSQGTVSQSITP